MPRNLDDEQLRAIAHSGGLVSAVAYAPYLRAEPTERKKATSQIEEGDGLHEYGGDCRRVGQETLIAIRERLIELDAIWPRATVSDYVEHIDHLVAVAGIDHVGISSDFPAGGVRGWMDQSEAAAITVELVRRGYSDLNGQIMGRKFVTGATEGRDCGGGSCASL